MSPSTARGSLNRFFDEWRAIIYIATALGLVGTGVLLPNARITRLEAQQAKDRRAADATAQYMRVLATATCLDDNKPKGNLMTALCARVMRDNAMLELP